MTLVRDDARGDVTSHGDLKAVWLKDPDGNILNLTDMTM